MIKRWTLFGICFLVCSLLCSQTIIEAPQSVDRLKALRRVSAKYVRSQSKSLTSKSEAAILEELRELYLKEVKDIVLVPKAKAIDLNETLKGSEAALNAQMDKDLPVPSEAELEALAEKTYPLYKKGEKVQVAYASGNPDIPHMVEGYFRGKVGPYIRVGNTAIRLQDIKVVDGNELELLKFDKDATEVKRKEFIAAQVEELNQKRSEYSRTKRAEVTSRLVADAVKKNENAGYTYLAGEWLSTDALLKLAIAQIKERLDDKVRREAESAKAAERNAIDRQVESLLAAQKVMPPGERLNPEAIMAKQAADEAARIAAAAKEKADKEAAAAAAAEQKAAEEARAERAAAEAAAKAKAEEEARLAKQAQEAKAREDELANEAKKQADIKAEKLKKTVIIAVIAAAAGLIIILPIVSTIISRKNKKDPFAKFFEGKGKLQKDFWDAANTNPEHFKYVAYMFPTVQEATMALSKLSYITIDGNGDLHCTRDLQYGVYPHLDGAVCFIGGTNFHYALWREASAVLPELENATYFKVSTEPEVKLELPDLAKLSADKQVKIEDLGTEDIESETGEFNRLFKYKTESMETALDFLDTLDVNEAGIIIQVQTPEGIVGKDENGVFSLEA